MTKTKNLPLLTGILFWRAGVAPAVSRGRCSESTLAAKEIIPRQWREGQVMKEETFTTEEVISALEQMLEYAEGQFRKSHNGYFSGEGWAARCLKWHKEQMNEEAEKKRKKHHCLRCGNETETTMSYCWSCC